MKVLHILVAEDDVLIGRLLSDVLAALGHVATIVTSEEAAVHEALSSHPDLMVVDVSLGHGNGNGIDAVERVLRVMPMPHIFLTGDPSKVWTARPDAVVLQKPFRQRNLGEAIARLIDQPRH